MSESNPSSESDPLLAEIFSRLDALPTGLRAVELERLKDELPPHVWEEVANLHNFDELVRRAGNVPAGSSEIPAHTVPAKLGQYKLLEAVGRGGMGVVYKAQQESDGQFVAVKVLQLDGSTNANSVARFKYEATCLQSFRCEGVVKAFGSGECDGYHYFVMEFIEGETLLDRIRHGPLDPKAAARCVRACALTVARIHEFNHLHRDLKPTNIIIDKEDRPWITDLGLAKALDGPTNFTRSGALVGTPQYMSPEQAGNGLPVGFHTDVYLLGATLYHAVTGSPPRTGNSPAEVYAKILRKTVVHPRRRNHTLPAALADIIVKCLQEKPDRRYLTARELAEDLQRFLDGRPVGARPSALERGARLLQDHPKGIAAAFAALVLMAAISLPLSLHLRDLAETAQHATGNAERERDRARLAKTIAEANAGSALSALDRLYKQILNNPSDDPQDRALLASMVDTYAALAEVNVNSARQVRRVAESLYRLGVLQERLGNRPEAIAAFERSLAAWVNAEDKGYIGRDEAAASRMKCYDRLCANHQELLHEGDTATAFAKGVEEYGRLSPKARQAPENRWLLASLKQHHATLHRDLGELEPAERLFNESLSILEQLPPTEKVRADKASVAANLAAVYRQKAMLGDSRKLNARAEAALRHPTLYDHPSENVRFEYRLRLLRVLHNSADIASAEGEFEQAVDQWTECIEEGQALLGSRGDFPDARWVVASAFHNRANAYLYLDQLREADADFREAVTQFATLESRFPDNHRFKNEGLLAFGNWSSVAERQGNLQAAEERVRQAVEGGKKLVAEHSKSARYRKTLNYLLNKLGRLQSKQRVSDETDGVDREAM